MIRSSSLNSSSSCHKLPVNWENTEISNLHGNLILFLIILTSSRSNGLSITQGGGGGGGTLHKFGQGCSFVDIFRLPKKITGSKFQTQKMTAFFVPEIDVILVLQFR